MSIDQQTKVYINQHRLFYQQMRATTPVQGVMAMLWFGILRFYDNSVFPIVWLVVFVSFLSFRYLVYSKIKVWDDFKIASRINLVNRNGFISAVINGLIWSSFYIYSFYLLPERWMLLFSSFVILLMSSGFITLSSHKHSFYAFSASLIVPIICFTFAFADTNSTLFYMGFLYIMFSLNILGLHKNINRTIIESLENAIENKRLANDLKELSNTDSLTKLSNRRHFEEVGDLILREAISLKQSMAVLMIDIDYFKLFNDNYGHLQGDNVLEQVAKAAKGALIKKSDLIARYGGEEFIVVLSNIDSVGAEKVANKLVKVIESLSIENEHSKASSFVTISAGLASIIPTVDSKLEGIIAKADLALYQAKENGRNRYCVFDPTTSEN